jgi:hypothetical protein
MLIAGSVAAAFAAVVALCVCVGVTWLLQVPMETRAVSPRPLGAATLGACHCVAMAAVATTPPFFPPFQK